MKQTELPKELTRLFYPVEKVLATDHAPGLLFPSGKEYFIIAPKANNLVLNSCSSIYELITNKQTIMPFYEGLTDSHNIEVKLRSWSHTRFKLEFIFKDRKCAMKKVGDLFPRVSMVNSYDGSVKFALDFGFYRLKCTNGLIVPDTDLGATKIKMRHTPKAGAALTNVMENIEEFLLQKDNLVHAYDPLLENKLRMAQAESRINELVEEQIFPQRSAELAMDRLRLEAREGEEINDFLVYNAMNYALNNNPESKANDTKIDNIDRQVLDYLMLH